VKRSYLVLLLFLYAAIGHGQTVSDTANVQFADSGLYRFHDFNQAFRGNNFYNSKGNLFVVGKNLVYSDSNSVGFRIMPSAFSLLENTGSGLSGFPQQQIYTEVMYAMGLKKEQFFTVTHRQVINKKTAFAMDFRKLKTDGYLSRSQTDVGAFSAAIERKEFSGKYLLNLKGSYEREMIQENGGIADGLLILNQDLSDKRLLNIQLPDARNTRRIRTAEIINTWNFGKIDSSKVDTVMIKKVVATGAIWHKISYSEYSWIYKDTLPGNYYPRYYFDADSTNDKLLVFTTANYLGWKTLARKHSGAKRDLLFSVNGKYEYINYFQNNIQRNIQNAILQGSLFSANGNWKSEGAFTVNGYNAGDFFLSGTYGKSFLDSAKFASRLLISAYYRSAETEYTYQQYFANNYQWSNAFPKVNTGGFSLVYHAYRYFMISVAFRNISNYVYLNQQALPVRYAKDMQVATFLLQKNFVVKHLHFDNFICYQSATDRSVVNIPAFLSKHSLYFEGYIFKHAMNASTGFDMTYFSRYYANAYSPALNQFYVQELRTTGNYPQVDFFLSFKVKTVRAFFRVDNINNYLMSYPYYMVPTYLMPGTTMKFGVAWRFYN
jgi:hypothetical protein